LEFLHTGVNELVVSQMQRTIDKNEEDDSNIRLQMVYGGHIEETALKNVTKLIAGSSPVQQQALQVH
jgi:hypothetical protein